MSAQLASRDFTAPVLFVNHSPFARSGVCLRYAHNCTYASVKPRYAASLPVKHSTPATGRFRATLVRCAFANPTGAKRVRYFRLYFLESKGRVRGVKDTTLPDDDAAIAFARENCEFGTAELWNEGRHVATLKRGNTTGEIYASLQLARTDAAE